MHACGKPSGQGDVKDPGVLLDLQDKTGVALLRFDGRAAGSLGRVAGLAPLGAAWQTFLRSQELS